MAGGGSGQDTQRALAAARGVTSAASLAGAPSGVVGPLGIGLGAAGLLANPSGENALKFAGQTITSPATAQLAAQVLGSGAPAGVTAAEAGISAFPGLAAGATPGLVMAAWQLPAIVDTIYNLANGNETAIRQAKRTATATGLENQVIGPLSSLKTPQDWMTALRTPTAGGSSVGDTLAAILKFNEEGTWYTDTAHGWRPDPLLLDAQAALKRLGYTGAREPKAGDVGGVGEMVMGNAVVAPWENPTEFALDTTGAQVPIRASNQIGARGWDALLRQLTGVPKTAPSVWDFDAPLQYARDPASGDSVVAKTPASDYQRFLAGGSPTAAVKSDPDNLYGQYLDALPADIAQKLRDFEIAKNAQAQAVSFTNMA